MGSGQPWGWETVLAAGGLDSDVHKAEVVVATYPAIPDLPLTIRFLYGTAYKGVNTDATLLPQGPAITDVAGMVLKTFTSGDRMGDVLVEALSEMDNLTQLVRITQAWDDPAGAEFDVPPYFVPGYGEDVKFFCRLADESGIGGHRIQWYTYRIHLDWFWWNLDTGESDWGVDDYTYPFVSAEDTLPFGLTVQGFVAYTDGSEDPVGVYHKKHTVTDYFDIVTVNGQEVWQEALVLAYDFALYDQDVRLPAP
jgi:hypothetical protein